MEPFKCDELILMNLNYIKKMIELTNFKCNVMNEYTDF